MRENSMAGTGREALMEYRNLIDVKSLKRLQTLFCKSHGFWMYNIDADGEQITELIGTEEERAFIAKYTEPQRVREAVERVAQGSLEELVMEDTLCPSLKLAAMSIRVHNHAVMTCVIYAVISDEPLPEEHPAAVLNKTLSEKKFNALLNLLNETLVAILESRLGCVNAEAESVRSKYSAIELQSSMDRLAAMTEVVQLLDSDEEFERLAAKFLRIICEHLHMTSGFVGQVDDGEKADILAEYYQRGIMPAFETTHQIDVSPLFRTEMPVVASTDSMDEVPHAEDVMKYGVKAFMLFPIVKKGNGGMYLFLSQTQMEHTWALEEVKFASDAVKIFQNIVTRRVQKNSLASSYASMETTLDNVGCYIYVRESDGSKMLLANRKMRSTFAAELRDGTFDALLERATLVSGQSGLFEINYTERERWYDMIKTQINWVDGHPVDLFSLYDITDKKLYQRKIEQQAYTDFLTGLYNRMCCERDLAWHVDNAKKNNVQGGLLYLDLDDFKHINDGLGHQYGDVLLKAISGAMARIEGIKTTCYRMGGDEFVIVVPPDSYKEFGRIIEDIKKIFAKPWFLKDADYYCTMSMGIVTFPDDGDKVQDLIKKADIAMYEAKKTGKNRIARYSDGLESNSGRRLDMEKNLRDATVGGYKEFEVFYQPIIDISLPGQPCTGAEALIRWNSTEMGFIPPAEFIPLAEYLGLINPIGNHVLWEACEECKRWNDNGYPNFKVNVNLSVVQLLQADIVEIVEDTLKKTQITPRNLTLEVTESLAINDMERMKEILGRIKALGVRIALDDFGTGYSSLNHIREIPFDVIKVDQSFVKDLADDAYSQSFIKMVAELGETLNASICVEGIETEAQYRVLEGMKVRMIQGYYFDRPMKREDFERKYTELLAKKNGIM